MSKVSDKETRHIADLIKIDVDGDDVAKYQGQLERSLDPAQDLDDIDTTGIEILSHPTGLTTIGAADQIEAGLANDDALQNAKANSNEVLGYIKVPQVLAD